MLISLVVAVLSLCISEGYASPVTLPPSVSVNSNSEPNIFAESSSLNCPPGFVQPANSNWDKCYKVYTSYKTRKDAAADCESNNGQLASVSNAYVNSYLYSLATQSGATSLWLGVQCSSELNTCINDDETKFDYNNFYQGQPTANDICVYMSAIGRDSQKWSTFACQQRFQYACEVESNGVKQLRCPENYTEFQGTCYKVIYKWFITHNDLIGMCIATPGGEIVSIHSEKVNQFLMNMPSECPSTDFIIIGLRCSNVTVHGDSSTCAWDDGTPFDYNGFHGSQPIPTNDNNTCISVINGGWCNIRSCDERMTCGICQAPMY